MTRGRPRRVLPIDELAEKYAAGRSIRDLALTYQAAYGTIRRNLKDHGVELRPPHSTVKPEGWRT